MKKIITALALVAAIGIAFTATNASAWSRGGNGMMHGNGYGMGNGYTMGMGGGYGMGPGMMGNGANVDSAAYQKFLDQTTDLRTALAADRAEMHALMAGTNPDPARARELSTSMMEKRNQLASIARDLNIAPMGFGRFCDGTGPRHGYGRRW